MQVPEPQFVLNTTTLAAIGGIMGVLTGAISFLTKALLDSKEKQIAELQKDRDYYRDRFTLPGGDVSHVPEPDRHAPGEQAAEREPHADKDA